MIVSSEHYPSNAIAVVLPLHMLAAFALELYFKAWLLKAGVGSEEVKRHNHDINRLYDDCRELGLPEIESLEEMKGHFAGPHSDFTYRYIKPGGQIDNTNWPLAFTVFGDLDCQTDTFIGASARQGLQPGH